MVGSILFVFLFVFSFVGFVGRIQAALLFNIKFAKSLKRGRLLVSPLSLRTYVLEAALRLPVVESLLVVRKACVPC